MEKMPWAELARALKFDNATDMWDAFYIKKELSIAVLARKFGCSTGAVRTGLVDAKIELRKRGGPHLTAPVLTVEEIRRVEEGQGRALAKELKLSYGALYKRYRNATGVSITQAKARQAEQTNFDRASFGRREAEDTLES